MASRQEVFNVILAQLLQERGFISAPEQILSQPAGSIQMPDVVVDLHGLRLMIECEFGTRSPAAARKTAYRKARERVEGGIAQIGVAVVYPARLKNASFRRITDELAESELEYLIITEATLHPFHQMELFPLEQDPNFLKGTVNDLGDTLRRAYAQMVRDETVSRAVGLLEESIAACLNAFVIQPATCVRMAEVLGVHGLGERELTKNQRLATNRISALIIVNAMIFQEVLSQTAPRVEPLGRLLNNEQLIRALQSQWDFILREINYYPIFYTATELLSCFSSEMSIDEAMKNLINAALAIVRWRASLRHDLAGRIYHRILEQAKYLGAYYTSIPAATLLLKLALEKGNYALDWTDIDSLKHLRIADLACGTGTLLMASADCAVDNYVRECAAENVRPDLDLLHEVLIEKVIYGWDVLPSAIHLTASTLSLRIPDRPIKTTNLCCVLHGGSEALLGSLEALEHGRAVGTLFSKPTQVDGTGDHASQDVQVPELDLCVMNPPFTSSRGSNRLFGTVPERERQVMLKKLRRIVRQQQLPASVTAGLGSIFVALADKYLKPHGVLALVLQRSITSGVSWKKTRKLIADGYELNYLVVSHKPGHWNFSENTNLSEVMLVARKHDIGGCSSDSKVRCINLWNQPRNAVEALSVAKGILETEAVDITANLGSTDLRIGHTKFGEMFDVSWETMKGDLMSLYCCFAQTELVRALQCLRKGEIYLPGHGIAGEVPLCPLAELANFGPDRRDVYDAFARPPGSSATVFPTLWGHEPNLLKTMMADPNRYLTPLSAPLPGRPLRSATDLWSLAGRLLVARRTRLNTKCLTAVRMTTKVLSDVWCPLSLKDSVPDHAEVEKALVMWLNSTFGLISLIGYRQETAGAYVEYTKQVLSDMPVLDARQMEKSSLKELAKTYDELSGKPLKIIPELGNDSTRHVIDTCLMQVLDLPDLSILREMLAREPILCQSLERLS